MQLHGGTKREGHLDLDGLCQANQVYKSHGLKNTVFRLPQGVFMDISPFMTLLQCEDTDVWLAKEEQGGRVGLKTLYLLQQIQFVLLKLPEDPEDFRLVLFVFLLLYPWKCAKHSGCYFIFFLCAHKLQLLLATKKPASYTRGCCHPRTFSLVTYLTRTAHNRTHTSAKAQRLD